MGERRDSLGAVSLAFGLAPLFLLPLTLLMVLFGSLAVVSLAAAGLALVCVPAGVVVGLVALVRARREGARATAAAIGLGLSLTWLLLGLGTVGWFFSVGGKGLIESVVH